VAIASDGLRNIAHHGLMDPDERGFLNPLHALLEDGRSPGERVLALWEGEWKRSVARLIEYARY
jgi:gamma-glutamylcysteine synthetase